MHNWLVASDMGSTKVISIPSSQSSRKIEVASTACPAHMLKVDCRKHYSNKQVANLGYDISLLKLA